MKNEELLTSLQQIEQDIKAIHNKLTQDSQKIRVALSSVMRLVKSDNKTIIQLGGSSDDLLKYVINLSTEHETSLNEAIEHILTSLSTLIDSTSQDLRNG